MESKVEDRVLKIRKLVKRFNEEATTSQRYVERRNAETTPTVFFDYTKPTFPPLRPSPVGWCTISTNLASLLETSHATTHSIEFDAELEWRCMINKDFREACKTEVPQYLKFLADIYLNSHCILADSYEDGMKERVKRKMLKLKDELSHGNIDFAMYPSLVGFIRCQVKLAKKSENSPSLHKPRKSTRSEIAEKAMQLHKGNRHSVSDICAICHISKTKYYTLCKEQKYFRENKQTEARKPGGKTHLSEDQLKFIKYLADRPNKSFTVPEMCAELAKEYECEVGKKAVYYQLTKKLGYSYKRNHFKYPTAFSSGQTVVKYKVCKALIDFLREGKNVISVDESGFHIGIQKEYSYAKKGEHPYRMCRFSAKRLNILMAISNQTIFAYQAREAGHNEHTFSAFLLDLADKIYSMGPDFVSKDSYILRQRFVPQKQSDSEGNRLAPVSCVL